MTLNLQVLRDELEYLVNVEKFPFGILMDNGKLNYLQELEIDEKWTVDVLFTSRR